ncbi:MAG: hypothetical protein C5B50_03870 [Verrucomicrobia bacterium]|nr:MAG: hypothetical protein C5B50_03870 [Verrucomicrobiota bacterium]
MTNQTCPTPPLRKKLNGLNGLNKLNGKGLSLLLLSALPAVAWDYEGHRTVNQLALASLPTNFPAFVRVPAAAERVAFLAGEPDRWRNSQDVSLRQYSFPDHYIDLEQLSDYGLKCDGLPVFRYDFTAQLGVIRKAQPDKFPAPDPEKDRDHTHALVGLLPWAITENAAKLRSCFSYLKTFEASGGTPEEISNAQQNILYIMGTMGHYVGDASQPLHTTIHHHGWVGDNPHHYRTDPGIHSWIDGGFFRKMGGADLKGMQAKLRTAQRVSVNGHSAQPEETFQASMAFIQDANKSVELIYQMDQDGRLSGRSEGSREAKAFLEGQLLKSGQFLGDIWYSAWQQAGPDTFLERSLAERKTVK